MHTQFDYSRYAKALCDSIQQLVLGGSSSKKYALKSVFFELPLDAGDRAFDSLEKRTEIALERSRSAEEQNLIKIAGLSTKDTRAKIRDAAKILEIDNFQLATGEGSFENVEFASKRTESGNSLGGSSKDDARTTTAKDLLARIASGKQRLDSQMSRASIESRRLLERTRLLATSFGDTYIADSSIFSERGNEPFREESHNPGTWANANAIDALSVERVDKRYRLFGRPITSQGGYRTLLIANAGQGKTTLLKRVALHYLDGENELCDRVMKAVYGLESGPAGGFLPCLIFLRHHYEKNMSFEALASAAIIDLLDRDSQIRQDVDVSVQDWIKGNVERLLFLVDGFDELTDDDSESFLSMLETFLSENELANLVVSSRVAGLGNESVLNRFLAMSFASRSILPLTDENRVSCARRWIESDEDFSSEEKASLVASIANYSQDPRFCFMDQFMSTPLELIIVLRQVSSGRLNFNRYAMFSDMLRELFTSKITGRQKRLVFEDTLNLLSAIALDMQEKGSLTITVQELKKLCKGSERLSFHSGLLEVGDFDGILTFLEDLASNTGVIERNSMQMETFYSFPIRSYQEFLAAYACCHLESAPDSALSAPVYFARKHRNDKTWISVLCFILADLEESNPVLFEEVQDAILFEDADIEIIRSIFNFNISFSDRSARFICEHYLVDERLAGASLELLELILNCPNLFIFDYQLGNLYTNFASVGEIGYLEARASVLIFNWVKQGNDAYQKACELLSANSEKDMILGSACITLLCQMKLSERTCGLPEDSRLVCADGLYATKNICGKLYLSAIEKNRPCFAEALVHLWVSAVSGYEYAQRFLDDSLAIVLVGAIDSLNERAKTLMISGLTCKTSAAFIARFTSLCYALGCLPVVCEYVEGSKRAFFFSQKLMEFLYERSRVNPDMDQTAFAISLLNYTADVESFSRRWIEEVCGSLPCEAVSKRAYSDRQGNHFEMARIFVKKYLADASCASAGYDNERISPLGCFLKGNYVLGARMAYKRFKNRPSYATANDLAFLLRFGKIDSTDIGASESIDLLDLLASGVAANEPYSMINCMLVHIERGQYDQAVKLIKRLWLLDDSGNVVDFWRKHVWLEKGETEGALVCTLLSGAIGEAYDDLTEMCSTAATAYPELMADEFFHQILSIDNASE